MVIADIFSDKLLEVKEYINLYQPVHGKNFSRYSGRGRTPLEYACDSFSGDIIEYLLNCPQYIICSKELKNCFDTLCRLERPMKKWLHKPTDTAITLKLLGLFLQREDLILSPKEFGALCRYTSTEVFNKIVVSMLNTVDSEIIDSFTQYNEDVNDSNLIYLIKFGCVISEHAFMTIHKFYHPSITAIACYSISEELSYRTL